MKNIIRFSAILAMVSAAQAAPFLAVGDGAEIFLTGTLGVRVDDNIYLAKDATNDVIFDINPGLSFTFGKDATVKGSLTYVEAFANYTDNSRLNTNLASLVFATSYDDGKLKLGFGSAYRQLNQNTADVQGLTKRDNYTINGKFEVAATEKSSFAVGALFDRTQYKRAGFANTEIIEVPVDYFYKITPKVDLSFGYRYRATDLSLGSNSTDSYYNIGARGEFTPKLTGRFTVGLNQRKFDPKGDETLPGVSAAFDYALTPKTSLNFGMSNDFGSSGQGLQQKNLTFNAGITSQIADDWSLSTTLSYRKINYYTRTDDFLEGQIGANYIINATVTITGAYAYRNNSSPVKSTEFTNNVFSLAANFRY